MVGDITVMVIDDHAMVRQGLELALGTCAGLSVLPGAATAAAGIERARACRPNVVVADLQLSDGSGTHVARALQDSHPAMAVLIITGSPSTAEMADIVASGCAGYLEKGGDVDRLANAIRSVAAGDLVFPRSALAAASSRPSVAETLRLSPRELHVLQLLAKAASAEEIGAALSISVNTARNHISSILMKLSARNQLEAVVKAASLGLVVVGDQPGTLSHR